MKKPTSTHDEAGLYGVVYRVPDSTEPVHRWVAKSVHGHVAHGTTAANAMRRLEEHLRARAEEAGKTFEAWLRAQDRTRPRSV